MNKSDLIDKVVLSYNDYIIIKRERDVGLKSD
jgi:hypothetical protein